MPSLKSAVVAELSQIDGFESRPSEVAGGTALFYRGKEFAHFHHDAELDLRLTSKVIKSLGLTHPPRSEHHPKRSPSSQWIEVRFTTQEEATRLVQLVKAAIEQL